MIIYNEFSYPAAGGGNNIYACEWRDDTIPPKAVLQIAHGINEYSGRYTPFAEYLVAKGYIVAANDHAGHGKSAENKEAKGYFSNEEGWNNVVKDIRTLYLREKDKYPHLPYFMLGHSMGSFLIRTYLIDYDDQLAGAIISGTANMPQAVIYGGIALSSIIKLIYGDNHRSKLLRNLCFFGYNKQFKPNINPMDWLSRDEKVTDAYIHDKHCRFIPTTLLYKEMFGGIKYMSNKHHYKQLKPDLPILLISGEKDPVGNNGKGIHKLHDDFRKADLKNVTMKLYPECRHELLNELNREEIYADIINWLDSNI